MTDNPASPTKPISLRLAECDRELALAAAHYLDEPLSAFVRRAIAEIGAQVSAEASADGVDIIAEYRAAQQRRTRFERDELKRRRRW
jgi:hypothetical protein